MPLLVSHGFMLVIIIVFVVVGPPKVHGLGDVSDLPWACPCFGPLCVMPPARVGERDAAARALTPRTDGLQR